MSLPPAPPPLAPLGLVRKIKNPRTLSWVRAVRRSPGVDDLVQSVLGQNGTIFQPPVRSTAMRTYTVCHRLFFYVYRLGLVSAYTYAPALRIGTWYHSFLEYARKHNRVMLSVADADTLFDEWMAKTIEPLVKNEMLPDGEHEDVFEARSRADFLKAYAMAHAHLHIVGTVPVRLETPRTEMVEHTTVAKLKGIGRPIMGTLDVVAVSKVSDRLWILDDKTTSHPPTDVIAALPFDLQGEHYRLLVSAEYTDRSIEGIIHTVVAKPTIKFCPDTKDKDGPDAYGERVVTWFKTNLEVGHHDSRKMPILHSETRFANEPSQDYIALLREVARKSAGPAHLSRYHKCCNFYTCMTANAGRPCRFVQLCRRETPANWSSLIPSKFKQADLTTLTERSD